MQIVCWNVNGLRAVMKKGFETFISEESPDIVCLQEIKAREDQVDLNWSEYHYFWNSAEKPGYSGTLIMSKIKPLSIEYGMGIEKHDSEGRVICLEYEKCFLINVYTPNSQRELARLDYRTNEWDRDFLKFVKGKERVKPVVFCGDLNVAHKEIDLANPKTNKKNAGFTPQERESFDRICEAGFIDTFREFHDGNGHYTWWSYRAGARARNVGWRIDYFCISNSLKKDLVASEILADVMGSDHCPIRLTISGDLFQSND